MIKFIFESGTARKELDTGTLKSGLKIRTAIESEQVFTRNKLTGSINVSGLDYAFLKDNLTSCCSEILFTVEQDNSPLIRAVIDPYEIEFNDSQCKATINTFTPKDYYTAILANWEKEVNVMDYASNLVTFSVKAGKPNQTRGRWLKEVLHYLLTETLKGTAGINVVRSSAVGYSQFLDADTNPVTGLPNKEKNLVLVQMADAKIANALQPTLLAKMTLKAFLNELKWLFNLRWDVDENGQFRIEHRQFYDMGKRYDIRPVTALPDIRGLGLPVTYKYARTNQYGGEYLEISNNETLLDNGDAFINTDPSPMWYKAGVKYDTCVAVNAAGETETNTFTSAWTTNYDALLENPTDSGRTGWVVAHLVPNSSTWKLFLDPETGKLNSYLMASVLFSAYHDWGRSFVSGRFFEIDAGRPGTLRMVRFTAPGRIWAPLSVKVCQIEDLAPFGPVRFAGDTESYSFVTESEWDFVRGIQSITIQSPGLCSAGPFKWGSSGDGVGCLPAGTYLRSVTQPPRQSTGNKCIKYEYYADGKCGETVSIKQC